METRACACHWKSVAEGIVANATNVEELARSAYRAWKANGSLTETAHRVYGHALRLGFKGHLGQWSAYAQSLVPVEDECIAATPTFVPEVRLEDQLPTNSDLESWLKNG